MGSICTIFILPKTLIVLDKKRVPHLLLIGSLAAVAYTANFMLLGDLLGLLYYKVSITPFSIPILVSSVTISPVINMIAEQYSSSWKGFIIRSAIGFAILNFGVFLLYSQIGILEFHNWNVALHFLDLTVLSFVVRLVFLWFMGIGKRHTQKT